MDLPVAQGAYNLLEAKWIPVLYGDGRTDRVGICEALLDARAIRQIAASNPMDRAALLRFLLAVLMWCKDNAKAALAALDQKGAGIPEKWLEGLEANKDAFNLLGSGKRFYQNESLKGNRKTPIGGLFVEFPGADSLNHLRHVVYDGSWGICPACCAMGILRLSVWAPANGSYPASVNPGSAAYAFAEGGSLFRTFHANLPAANPLTDQAPWLGDEQPSSPDAVAKLAWRPRKLWLNVGKNSGPCAVCGGFGELITSLCYAGGWPTPRTSSQKFAEEVKGEFKRLGYTAKAQAKVLQKASLIRECRMDALRKACGKSNVRSESTEVTMQTDAQEIAALFHQLTLKHDVEAIRKLTCKASQEERRVLRDEDLREKKFWDADPHLLMAGEPISLPVLEADVSQHSSRFWRDALRLQKGHTPKAMATGPVVRDFIFHDVVSVTLPAASDGVKSQAHLSKECGNGLASLLRKAVGNSTRANADIDAAVILLTPNVEDGIRNRLSRTNVLSGASPAEDRAFLHEVYAPMVEQAIASVTPGPPLHRHVTLVNAQALLSERIEQLVMGDVASTTPATIGKGRKRRGSK